MKNFLSIIFIISVLSLNAENREKIDAFFAKNKINYSKLPKDKVYPQGKLFPFTFFSVGGGSVEKRGNLLPERERYKAQAEAAEAGITMIGPQYELNNKIIADATRAKVKAFYTICPHLKGRELKLNMLKDLTNADFLELEKDIREKVSKAAKNKNIAWWYIQPEELRYWKKNEIKYLKLISKIIKEIDPLKRPIWMYEPGHRNHKALAKLAPYMDIIGKGMYANYSGFKNDRVWCRWTIEQEKIAAAKVNPDALIIAVPEMFQQPSANEIKLIEKWVRHDVYSALISGAKGIVVFSLSERPNFQAHDKYREAYFQACRELCGEMNLGEIILFGKLQNDIELSILKGPEKLTCNGQNFPSIGMRNLAFKGKRYVFMVNSSNKTVEAVVGDLPYGNVKVRNLFSPAPVFTVPEGDFTTEFAPLEVKVFEIYRKK